MYIHSFRRCQRDNFVSSITLNFYNLISNSGKIRYHEAITTYFYHFKRQIRKIEANKAQM